MFCTNCGSKIKDGAAFCGNCGAPVKKRPQQQNEIPESSDIEAPEEFEKSEIINPEPEEIPNTEVTSGDDEPEEIPDTEVTLEPSEPENTDTYTIPAFDEPEKTEEYIKYEPANNRIPSDSGVKAKKHGLSPALKIGIIALVVLLVAFAAICVLVYFDVIDIPVIEKMLGAYTPAYVDRDHDDDDDGREDDGDKAEKVSERGLNSYVMDMSDVTWFVECEYGKDALKDCRYYEFYLDRQYFILAQCRKNKDEYDYWIFGYGESNIDRLYYSRCEYDDAFLAVQGSLTDRSITTTDESKLDGLAFTYYGYTLNIYIDKDGKSGITKIAVSSDEKDSSVTIFEYGYKDGRLSRIEIYNDNLPGLSEKGYRVRYSYSDDGNLSAVRNEIYSLDGKSSAGNSDWDFNYNFSYDSDGSRTGISEQGGSDAYSLRYTRNDDGRVASASLSRGSQEIEAYELEYLPDGTVKCSLLNGEAEDDGKLTVAVCANNEPYEYLEGGRIIGFDIDLISTIAVDLGLDCEIVELSYGDLPASLAEGTADVVMTATQVSSAFRNSCDASLPYHEDGYAVYLQKGSELVSEINRLLADYERSGYIETLLRRWGLYEEPATDYYILPNSNSAYLSESDLRGLSWEECCLARNEIFARHHRIFTTPEIAAYFESQSWYSGTVSPSRFSESVFNQYESSNLKLIQSYEDRVWGGSYY